MGGKKGDTSAPKQALYRRYRSTSFDELVGQEHVTELLKSAVESGAISHAYLFTGQRGTGKTSAARILAYAINNLPYDADAGHLDIIEIDAASNRRIDDIRDLREKVFIAPVSAKYKVYIIDEVHMLTGESFNALLKTIEEPPAHAVFILATTELHKVPATIVSRTQRFHFRPVAEEKVVAHLATIAKQEAIDIDEAALQLVAAHGGGSFRDSISLLDQLGSLGKPVTTTIVESILGRARSADITDIITALENHDQLGVRTVLQALLANGISPVTLSEQLVSTLLKEARPEKEWYTLSEQLMSVPKAHFPELLLMTTLLGFTATETQRSSESMPTKQQPAAKNLARAPQHKEQPLKVSIPPDKTSTLEAAPIDPLPKPDVSEQTTGKGTFDWQAVLAAAKKTNPALHSVLQRAEVNYDDATLTLSFQYALHRKKLEQQQYRTQLTRLVQDVCGCNPTLVIDDSGLRVADDTTKKVADLMGGGEPVTV